MIEELAEEGHPGVEAGRQADVGRLVRDGLEVGVGERQRLRIGRTIGSAGPRQSGSCRDGQLRTAQATADCRDRRQSAAGLLTDMSTIRLEMMRGSASTTLSGPGGDSRP